MAKLTAAARKKIPGKDFAGPGRSFPIEDKAHAIAAERDAGFKSPAEKAEIDAKVHEKYPGLGKKKRDARKMFPNSKHEP